MGKCQSRDTVSLSLSSPSEVTNSLRGAEQRARHKGIDDGGLISCHADAQYMTKFFNNQGSDTFKSEVRLDKMTKPEFRKVLDEFFNQPHYRSFWISYSGHGRSSFLGMELGGDWVVGGEYLSLEEIVEKFSQSTAYQRDSVLWIISDCCYSGAWVERAKKMKIPRLAIQASSQHNETSWEYDLEPGGYFTFRYSTAYAQRKITPLNIIPISLWFVKNSIHRMLVTDSQQAKWMFSQTPCCYKSEDFDFHSGKSHGVLGTPWKNNSFINGGSIALVDGWLEWWALYAEKRLLE